MTFFELPHGSERIIPEVGIWGVLAGVGDIIRWLGRVGQALHVSQAACHPRGAVMRRVVIAATIRTARLPAT